MPVTFLFVGIGTDEDVTQTYYAYLQRESDGLYFDADDSTFKAFGALVDGTLDLTEDPDQPGCWSLTLTLAASETGTYRFIPRDGLTDFLQEDGVERVYLVEGVRVQDDERDKVLLYEHYGSFQAFQLLDEDGEPISGATIRIYSKDDFDAGDLDTPIGVTFTDTEGYWVNPVPVSRTETYVVHYHKDSVIGPTSVEVIVP